MRNKKVKKEQVRDYCPKHHMTPCGCEKNFVLVGNKFPYAVGLKKKNPLSMNKSLREILLSYENFCHFKEMGAYAEAEKYMNLPEAEQAIREWGKRQVKTPSNISNETYKLYTQTIKNLSESA